MQRFLAAVGRGDRRPPPLAGPRSPGTGRAASSAGRRSLSGTTSGPLGAGDRAAARSRARDETGGGGACAQRAVGAKEHSPGGGRAGRRGESGDPGSNVASAAIRVDPRIALVLSTLLLDSRREVIGFARRLRLGPSPSVRASGLPTTSQSTSNAEDVAMTYDAFLCYSHHDRELALQLGRGISQFTHDALLGIRFLGGRRSRIFRADDLGQDLQPSTILSALEASRFLILLASPSAAQSAWVVRELEVWLRTRSRDSILVVLVDGTPESAIPTLLGDASDRLWLDLRWAKAVEAIADRPQFQDAIASLSAAIKGVSKDILLSQYARRSRRIRRTALGAVAALIMMTVMSVFGMYSATLQRREAIVAMERAEAAGARAAHAMSQAAAAEARLRVAEEAAKESRYRAVGCGHRLPE